MGKSQRFAVIARSQATKQTRSKDNPEGKVRSPGLGAKVGLPNLRLSSLNETEDLNVRDSSSVFGMTKSRSDLKRGNAVMRQDKIGLLEKETRLKSGEVDSGCEMR